MKTVTGRSFARAGLLGNPSDGYHGKATSIIVRNYSAVATVSSSNKLEFLGTDESLTFGSLAETQADDYQISGAGLLLAAARQFETYGKQNGLDTLQPVRIEFQSDIPQQVGIAGSSAIVIATLRALCSFHEYSIPKSALASLALAAEKSLGIEAGLQDRVIQAYEGAVAMNFEQAAMQSVNGVPVGTYAALDPNLITNLFVSFSASLSESTNVLHGSLRERYESGDQKVIDALQEIASLVEPGRKAIEDGNLAELSRLVDRNFDLRESICDLNPGHVKMVETARECGASAKYCGSGGAIIGVYPDENTYQRLTERMASIGCTTFKPEITSPSN